MPQSGGYIAAVDKIKGRGTDDISLEELSTKLKQDDKTEHCEVCPEVGLDFFAICCLQELPCSCLPAQHCRSPTLHHGRRNSRIRWPAEAAVQRRLLSQSGIPCVSWGNSLDQQKCLKISILLTHQIISLIKVGRISKFLESKQDPQGLSSCQTQAAYFSIPLQAHSFACVGSGSCYTIFQPIKWMHFMLIWHGSLVCFNYHKAFEKNKCSVTQYSILLLTNSCHCLHCKRKSKRKSFPRLENKLGTCDSGWLQFIF